MAASPLAIKKILSEGKTSIGSWISLGSVPAARLMARMGYQWLTVDLEHSAIDWETAAHLFGAIADAGCVPLARVPRGDHDHIKRVLDAGAHGIVVPMVNTVEQAKEAIAAAKFPPQGTRSVGAPMHAINFNMSMSEYYQKANDQILVILQTESPEGVANAEEIYQLPGIDIAFVGPYDLRTQMRNADGSEATDDEFDAMLNRIKKAAQKSNVSLGMYCSTVEDVKKRRDQGWQFLAASNELSMMIKEAEQTAVALGLKEKGEQGLY